jgi:hypothetical protein
MRPFIFDAVAVFDDRQRELIRDLVDAHLTEQIDYRLVDYHRASPSFRRLVKALLAIKPTNPAEDSVYKEIVARCFLLDNDRAQLEAAAGQSMSPLEWTGLLLLLVVLMGLLAVLPGGTVLGAIVAGVMASTLVTLVVLLRKLDLLRWHEQVTIWEPTSRLLGAWTAILMSLVRSLTEAASSPQVECGSSTIRTLIPCGQPRS